MTEGGIGVRARRAIGLSVARGGATQVIKGSRDFARAVERLASTTHSDDYGSSCFGELVRPGGCRDWHVIVVYQEGK